MKFGVEERRGTGNTEASGLKCIYSWNDSVNHHKKDE